MHGIPCGRLHLSLLKRERRECCQCKVSIGEIVEAEIAQRNCLETCALGVEPGEEALLTSG